MLNSQPAGVGHAWCSGRRLTTSAIGHTQPIGSTCRVDQNMPSPLSASKKKNNPAHSLQKSTPSFCILNTRTVLKMLCEVTNLRNILLQKVKEKFDVNKGEKNEKQTKELLLKRGKDRKEDQRIQENGLNQGGREEL